MLKTLTILILLSSFAFGAKFSLTSPMANNSQQIMQANETSMSSIKAKIIAIKTSYENQILVNSETKRSILNAVLNAELMETVLMRELNMELEKTSLTMVLE